MRIRFVRSGKGLYHGRIGGYYWAYARIPPARPSFMWGKVGSLHFR